MAASCGPSPEQFTDEQFGVPTVRDILKEMEKPGRDPRPEFKAAQFAEGIEDIKHLKPGMILEGVVSNVAAFGAFVDIGVHQDGLVHISALSDTFVKDPRDVVKAGDIVKVKVLEVDVARKRIALTRRLSDTPPPADAAAQSRDTWRGAGPARRRRWRRAWPGSRRCQAADQRAARQQRIGRRLRARQTQLITTHPGVAPGCVVQADGSVRTAPAGSTRRSIRSISPGGSTGLPMCASKPATMARSRSSSRT